MNCDHCVFDRYLEGIKYICKCCLPVVKLGSLYPHKPNCFWHGVFTLSTHLCDECVEFLGAVSLVHNLKYLRRLALISEWSSKSLTVTHDC